MSVNLGSFRAADSVALDFAVGPLVKPMAAANTSVYAAHVQAFSTAT